MGKRAGFCSAAFTSLQRARSIISERSLTGLLVSLECDRLYTAHAAEVTTTLARFGADLHPILLANAVDWAQFENGLLVDGSAFASDPEVPEPSASEAWMLNVGFPLPTSVWTSLPDAIAAIGKHGLSGTLTHHALNRLAYDVEIEQGRFLPRKESQRTSDFISNFTGGGRHNHFESGERTS